MWKANPLLNNKKKLNKQYKLNSKLKHRKKDNMFRNIQNRHRKKWSKQYREGQIRQHKESNHKQKSSR